MADEKNVYSHGFRSQNALIYSKSSNIIGATSEPTSEDLDNTTNTNNIRQNRQKKEYNIDTIQSLDEIVFDSIFTHEIDIKTNNVRYRCFNKAIALITAANVYSKAYGLLRNMYTKISKKYPSKTLDNILSGLDNYNNTMYNSLVHPEYASLYGLITSMKQSSIILEAYITWNYVASTPVVIEELILDYIGPNNYAINYNTNRLKYAWSMSLSLLNTDEEKKAAASIVGMDINTSGNTSEITVVNYDPINHINEEYMRQRLANRFDEELFVEDDNNQTFFS